MSAPTLADYILSAVRGAADHYVTLRATYTEPSATEAAVFYLRRKLPAVSGDEARRLLADELTWRTFPGGV